MLDILCTRVESLHCCSYVLIYYNSFGCCAHNLHKMSWDVGMLRITCLFSVTYVLQVIMHLICQCTARMQWMYSTSTLWIGFKRCL